MNALLKFGKVLAAVAAFLQTPQGKELIGHLKELFTDLAQLAEDAAEAKAVIEQVEKKG